ncbi:MAG: sugar ABC transporter permease [Caldilinea sp. CFX5]|nr:sugar ABC transporter permease [Caldilinea sp. CFX5]
MGKLQPHLLLRQERRLAFIFLLPALLLILLVYVLPTLVTFLISFQPANMDPNLSRVFGPEGLGQLSLNNYTRSFSDPVWRQAIQNTALYTVAVIAIGLLFSLVAALVLNQEFYGRGLLRALILVPWAVPPIVNGTTWGLVFHADIGTANGLLREFGWIDRDLLWLGEPPLALLVVVVATVWRLIPFMTLLLLAGLQTIGRELYESAEVDGANSWRRFRFITLPNLWPVMLSVTTLQIIWLTKSFDEIWALTQGGPSNATMVMNLWVYRQAFEFLKFGYGAALAYILTFLTVVVVFLYYSLNRRTEVP